MQAVHEITRDEHGNQIGSDGKITVTLMDGGRMFKRRAVKGVGTEAAEQVCWLVAEIDGVLVYQNGANVLITRKDMNP